MAITITDMVAPNTAYTPSATTVAAAGSDTIDASNLKDHSLLIMIENGTTDTEATVTIAAGAGSESTLGALAVTVAASATKVVTLEGARFKDADGDISVAVASADCNISAIELPY